MTISTRDRYILIGVVIVGALAAYWMLALSPKRDEAKQLDKDIAAAQQELDTAKQEKVAFAQAQLAFPRMYASLGRLGKAVPADQEVPSLLVQMNHAAAQASVDFRSVTLKLEDTADAPAPTPPPPAEGAAAGATGATGATGAAGSISGTATVPPAEFERVPFEYKFEGGFYKLKKLLEGIRELVDVRNQGLAVSGRLITIEGFSMKRGKVTVLATSYMLPAGQGLFGGATPEAPANVDPAAPQAASAGAAPAAPPTAAVTGP